MANITSAGVWHEEGHEPPGWQRPDDASARLVPGPVPVPVPKPVVAAPPSPPPPPPSTKEAGNGG